MPGLDSSPARAWLAAWAAGGQPGPVGTISTAPDLVAAAQYESIVALVDWRLNKAAREFTVNQAQDANPPLPEVIKAFTTAARDEALVSMVIEGESRRVLSLLADAGILGLLLKGSALAYWAYPQPHLRTCGDVDLLLPSREAAEQLSARLTASGYERSETSGELVAYELLCRRPVTGDWKLEIDIHWRLANSPLFSDVFTFDELMAESISIPALAPNARGLGSVHALVHACLHRAINLTNGVDDKLKWLYDLIVLMDVFTPEDWQKMMRIAIDKRLAGVVLNGLEMAAATFGRELPADIQVALKKASACEPLDAQRLSDWHYMQRKTFDALPTQRLRLRWLWQRVFPSRDYLAYLYDRHQQNYAALLFERLRRAMRRVKG